MKYAYEKEIVEEGYQKILLFRLPEEIQLVEVFLGVEIQNREWATGFYLKAIDEVLSGKKELQSVRGNIVALEISKDHTFVTDMLVDDGFGDACHIETEELKKLINAWLDEWDVLNQEQSE